MIHLQWITQRKVNAMEQIWANESSGKCTIVVMVYVSMKHVQICALQQNKFRPHQSLIFTKNCNQRSKPGQLRFNCTKKSVTKGKILRLKWQNNAKRFSVTTTTCALIIFHWNTFTDTWANLLRWPAYPGSVAQNSTLSTHDLKWNRSFTSPLQLKTLQSYSLCTISLPI